MVDCRNEIYQEWLDNQFLTTNEKLVFIEFYVVILKNVEKKNAYNHLHMIRSWEQIYFKARRYFNKRSSLFDMHNFTKIEFGKLVEMSVSEKIIARQQEARKLQQDKNNVKQRKTQIEQEKLDKIEREKEFVRQYKAKEILLYSQGTTQGPMPQSDWDKIVQKADITGMSRGMI